MVIYSRNVTKRLNNDFVNVINRLKFVNALFLMKKIILNQSEFIILHIFI